MQNVTTKVKGDELVITVNLKAEATPSKSGKTMVVGSTAGFKVVDGIPGGYQFNLNVTKAK